MALHVYVVQEGRDSLYPGVKNVGIRYLPATQESTSLQAVKQQADMLYHMFSLQMASITR